MAQLVIPLPREHQAEIKSCLAIFTLDGETFLKSPPIRFGDGGDIYLKGGKAHITLWRSETNCRELRVQLLCYGDVYSKQFIDKTPLSERILFGKSLPMGVHDMPVASDSVGALADMTEIMLMLPMLREIAAGDATLHTHPNTAALDKLGEDASGAPTWGGEPWPGGEGAELEFATDNDIDAMFELGAAGSPGGETPTCCCGHGMDFATDDDIDAMFKDAPET